MTYELQDHVVWIAGTRMISQGTDGLSRGDLTSGVMAGDDFLSHIPLNKGAFDRSPLLKCWLESALPGKWTWLETGADWYQLPFSDPIGRYVWAPPPSLADVAMEQLCKTKLMHALSSHVFVLPVSMTGRWRKQLLKAADVEFGVPVGANVWKEDCHENLVIGLMCLLLCRSPWSIKRLGRKELDKFRHSMFGMLRDSETVARGHLRKFWNSRLSWGCDGAWHGKCYKQSVEDNFPVLNQDVEAEDLVSDEKMEDDDPGRFREARDGDHLMTTFQCDTCHFENCKNRSPIEGNLQDQVALLGIRRANLHALWSRERSTVRANRLQGKLKISVSESAGWSDFALPKRGPYPVEDTFGMQAAVNLLLRSRDVGINAKTIQYETTRQLRSFLSNFVHATFDGHGDTFMSVDGNGSTVSRSATYSPWFKRFMRG